MSEVKPTVILQVDFVSLIFEVLCLHFVTADLSTHFVKKKTIVGKLYCFQIAKNSIFLLQEPQKFRSSVGEQQVANRSFISLSSPLVLHHLFRNALGFPSSGR